MSSQKQSSISNLADITGKINVMADVGKGFLGDMEKLSHGASLLSEKIEGYPAADRVELIQACQSLSLVADWIVCHARNIENMLVDRYGSDCVSRSLRNR